MQTDVLSMMKDMLDAMGIQTLYLKPPYEDAVRVDFGVSGKIYGDFDYRIVMEGIIKECLPDTIYLFRSCYYMYHTVFCFPEQIQKEYGYTHCVIGPILFRPISKEEFAEIMEKNHVDQKYGRDLRVLYSRLPYMQSVEQWNSIVISFCKKIFGTREIRLVQNHIPDMSMVSIRFNTFAVQPEPDFSTETIEKRYAVENRMLKAVKEGNYVEATLQLNEFVKYRILPRHNDAVRDMKNLLFVLNTLLRKSVELANVHPVYIDELSRKIAIQIERCTTENQLAGIRGEMVRKYCLMVNNYSRTGYSRLYRKSVV